jgi:hypothetical protein
VVFTVAAEAYDSYMGRYSIPLAPQFGDFAEVRPEQRVSRREKQREEGRLRERRLAQAAPFQDRARLQP